MELLGIRNQDYAVWPLAQGRTNEGSRDLLLIHGFQNDHSVWRPLVDRLAGGGHRIHALDLLGCGASSSPSDPARCSIDHYATDLLELCARLGLRSPVLVGHSLGGAIALQAVLNQQDAQADEPAPAGQGQAIGGVVLMAPASTEGMDFLPSQEAFETLAHPSREDQVALARAATRIPPSDEELAALTTMVSRATPAHIEGAATSMRDLHIQSRLAGLGIPALLICGDRDRHVPLRNHLATQQAIRRCGLQVYYDCGHVPFVERPDDCAEVVSRFLGTLGPGEQ